MMILEMLPATNKKTKNKTKLSLEILIKCFLTYCTAYFGLFFFRQRLVSSVWTKDFRSPQIFSSFFFRHFLSDNGIYTFINILLVMSHFLINASVIHAIRNVIQQKYKSLCLIHSYFNTTKNDINKMIHQEDILELTKLTVKTKT